MQDRGVEFLGQGWGLWVVLRLWLRAREIWGVEFVGDGILREGVVSLGWEG